MVSKKLMEKGVGARTGFRWRGGEITRFEGFSDAVFAFAVTLLIVSLEVPKTFNELLATMRGFAAFAICFFLLMSVWYEQYIFFRRYNRQDTYTIVLNAILIFVALFYVYPLKFLFTLLVNVWMGLKPEVHLPNGATEAVIEPYQLPMLMIVFGAGYVAVFLVFALLFSHAYRHRAELELNELEILDTRKSIAASLINAGVGMTSMLIAFVGGPRYSRLAGLTYPFLLAPTLTIYHTMMGRRRRRLEETVDTTSAAPRATAQERPNYGIDAPAALRSFFIFGASIVLLGVILSLVGQSSHSGRALRLGISCLWMGGSFLITGGVMIRGSKVGKLRLRDKVINSIHWRGNERVLDVGCGHGLMLIAAAKRLITGSAVGVDIWRSQDQAGNRPEATLDNARREGVADRIELKDGDARQLPFENESFDIVLSSLVLHNISDKAGRAKAVREIARVLRPGGQIAILDILYAGQYAHWLRDLGFHAVVVSGPNFSFIVPTRVLTATKPGAEP